MEVEPTYLRGYATFLDEEAAGNLAAIDAYCNGHCRDHDGLSGVMALYRPLLSLAADDITMFGGLTADRFVELGATLEATADAYVAGDHENAESILDTGVNLGADEDGIDGYREHEGSASGEYVHRAVSFTPPREHDPGAEFREWLEEMLNTWGVYDTLKEYLGIDLLEYFQPLILGNWGALWRIGEAWDQTAAGFDVVASNIGLAMDVLSPHWTSDCGTGASQEFEFHVREQWVPGVQALAQACVAIGAVATQQGRLWQTSIDGLMAYVDAGIRGLVREIKKLLKSGLTGDLWDRLEKLWDLVQGIIDAVVACIEYLTSLVEMFVGAVETIFEALDLYARFLRGDLNVYLS